MSTKSIFAIISLLLSFALFVPYYIGIWKKETKPHVLTWITWFILTALGFVLSYTSGGGAGAFTFALQSILCLSIAIYALIKKEKNVVRFDWIVFACVIIILLFYVFTQNALLSAIFAATVDCLGYIPTFRKSYMQPYQEPILTYVLTFASWLFSAFALSTFSVTTLVYPIALVVIEIAFVIYLLIRRRALKKHI